LPRILARWARLFERMARWAGMREFVAEFSASQKAEFGTEQVYVSHARIEPIGDINSRDGVNTEQDA